MKKIIPLIPSYNPTSVIVDYVKKLNEAGFDKILIIDDGSKSKEKFNQLKELKYCIVLTHQINLGKGAAIKTGFRYFMKNLVDIYDGVVTVDDDEQHSVEDALKLTEFFDNDSLILGVRNFDLKTVPLKSKLGNKITSFMFKLIYKKKISDTQTGLRIYPTKLINDICYLDGNNFDFETNVLIYCIRKEFNILEIGINTIYLNKNKLSRFKPWKDSIKIYKIFFKGRKKYK